jgi:hypothetical protein
MAGSSSSTMAINSNFHSHIPLATNSSHVSTSLSPEAVDQVFDYASFMWDTVDLWQQQQQLALEGDGEIHVNHQHATSMVRKAHIASKSPSNLCLFKLGSYIS